MMAPPTLDDDTGMTSSYRISIGMPVYNGERFLAETLDSLLGQTYTDFELIIADNASTDGTAEICHSYAARDSRIRYVRNETNIGVYGNCNKVIKLARGEYFKLAMADDVCHPTLLARCLEILDANSTVVLTYAKARFMDENGKWLNIHDPGWHLISESPLDRMQHVIVSRHKVNLFYGLMRSKILAQTRLFPRYASGDHRLIGELCLRGTFYEIPDCLFYRRIHPEASSQNSGLQWESEFFKGRPGGVELPFWHLCLDHARTVLSSDLSTAHKVACLRTIMGYMFSGKRQLIGEIQEAVAFLWRRPSRS